MDDYFDGHSGHVHDAPPLVRHILLAEPMVEDFARKFAGLGVEQVQELADSFRLDRCLTRDRLATAVRAPEIDPSTAALREG